MVITLFLVVVALMLVLASVLVRVLERIDAIGSRVRRVWLQLQNTNSMLMNAGYKVKKPKDWRDDFSETRVRKSTVEESLEDPRDWWDDE